MALYSSLCMYADFCMEQLQRAVCCKPFLRLCQVYVFFVR